MSSKNATISINPDDLVARLADIEKDAKGDIARVIELLLLENHVLRSQRSFGLNRGVIFSFNDFPRFLRLQEPCADETDTQEEESGAARED
ncbi:MAG: hypothetical protein P1U83_11400 [Roseovarius sp.]|nr:hypothetical protein [Roseovarius sp.]